MAGSVPPLIVLTRPQGKNALLSAALRQSGFDSLELPVLQLQPLAIEAGQVPDPGAFDLIVFVSSMALAAYESALVNFASPGFGGVSSRRPLFVAAVGAATANALRGSTVFSGTPVLQPAAQASSDSEGLWPQIEAKLSSIRSALIVRGQTGREWLGERLEAAGVRVIRHASYRRSVAVWRESQLEKLRVSGVPLRTVWLLTSSEAVDAVFSQLERHGLLHVVRIAGFVVVHPRIAERLKLQYADRFPDAVLPAVTLCDPDVGSMRQALAAVASL